MTFFLFSLALRLGRTVHELRQTLTASELKMWIAYDRLSPIGDWRGDVQAAQVATATINAQGGKLSLNDVLLKWGQTDEEKEISDFEEFLGGL
ncbi:phage tail assembly protein T [Rahnella sp. PCH160]|uniref:phage tail assembly protein T n=1 Tax=Rahnella sp. PCH160 TaxID=3447928 RepID=UPI0039FCBE46